MPIPNRLRTAVDSIEVPSQGHRTLTTPAIEIKNPAKWTAERPIYTRLL